MDIGVQKAATIIGASKHCIAFTGAGISVESGIPPFRGQGGIWNKYDPRLLDIDYFKAHPEKSWAVIKELFYQELEKATPNAGHYALAALEKAGKLKSIITQNIDGLHSKAGNQAVIEFHGSCQFVSCIQCGAQYKSEEISLDTIPPHCQSCRGLLKPDFVFFGESIPQKASDEAFKQAHLCDVMLVIGTTGEVMPAALLPRTAMQNGAIIIEINLDKPSLEPRSQDVYIHGKAGVILPQIMNELKLQP